MSHWLPSCLLVLSWMIPATVQSVEILSPADAMLSYPCLGCHPSNADSASEIPYIGGINEQRFIQAMSGFQAGTRPATVMGRIAKAYTQADVVSMARFFAGQSGQNRIIREYHDH